MIQNPIGVDIAIAFAPEHSGSFILGLGADVRDGDHLEVRNIGHLPRSHDTEISLLMAAYRAADLSMIQPPVPIPNGFVSVSYDEWLLLPPRPEEIDVRRILPMLCSRLSLLRHGVEQVEDLVPGMIDDKDVPRGALLRVLGTYWVILEALKEAGQLSKAAFEQSVESLRDRILIYHSLPFETERSA